MTGTAGSGAGALGFGEDFGAGLVVLLLDGLGLAEAEGFGEEVVDFFSVAEGDGVAGCVITTPGDFSGVPAEPGRNTRATAATAVPVRMAADFTLFILTTMPHEHETNMNPG